MKIQDLANYIIYIYELNNKEITNLKLQKLLYYIQGYFLKFLNKTAFSEEIINWRYGPAVPEVYNVFKIFGAEPLEIYDTEETENLRDDFEGREIVNRIIERSFKYSSIDLINKTRLESPWYLTTLYDTITVGSMESFFGSHDPLNLKIWLS